MKQADKKWQRRKQGKEREASWHWSKLAKNEVRKKGKKKGRKEANTTTSIGTSKKIRNWFDWALRGVLQCLFRRLVLPCCLASLSFPSLRASWIPSFKAPTGRCRMWIHSKCKGSSAPFQLQSATDNVRNAMFQLQLVFCPLQLLSIP